MAQERLSNESLENAIGVYKTTIKACENLEDEDYSPALDKATIAFLEELQQYRALGGTPELIAKVINFLGNDEDNNIINDLELLNQYRAIGTVQQCKEAVEKSQEMQLLPPRNSSFTYTGFCPVCGEEILISEKYCSQCGQKV